jgi:hypothetical protein
MRDLTGQTFGRLTAIEHLVSPSRWRCKCICGGEKITTQKNLRKGYTKSCGCLQRENGRLQGAIGHKLGKRGPHHGHTKGGHGSITYRSWSAMKKRCLHTSHGKFERYGGRGITVCKPWLDLRNFLADMGERPGKEYTLHRLNSDGNYEPANCRWAGAAEQDYRRPHTASALIQQMLL